MDMYSLGVLLFVMLTGCKPIPSAICSKLAYDTMPTSEYPGVKMSVFKKCSPAARDLVLSLMQRRPADRPNALNALGHTWLQHHARVWHDRGHDLSYLGVHERPLRAALTRVPSADVLLLKSRARHPVTIARSQAPPADTDAVATGATAAAKAVRAAPQPPAAGAEDCVEDRMQGVTVRSGAAAAMARTQRAQRSATPPPPPPQHADLLAKHEAAASAARASADTTARRDARDVSMPAPQTHLQNGPLAAPPQRHTMQAPAWSDSRRAAAQPIYIGPPVRQHHKQQQQITAGQENCAPALRHERKPSTELSASAVHAKPFQPSSAGALATLKPSQSSATCAVVLRLHSCNAGTPLFLRRAQAKLYLMYKPNQSGLHMDCR